MTGGSMVQLLEQDIRWGYQQAKTGKFFRDVIL